MALASRRTLILVGTKTGKFESNETAICAGS